MAKKFEVKTGNKPFVKTEIPLGVFEHKFWGKTKLNHFLNEPTRDYDKVVDRVGSEDASNWMSVVAHEMLRCNPFYLSEITPKAIDVIDGGRVFWVLQDGIPYRNETVIRNFAPTRLVKFRKLQQLQEKKYVGRKESPLFATIATFGHELENENLGQRFYDSLRMYGMYQVPVKNGELDRNLEEHDVQELVTVICVVSVPESIHDDVINLSQMMSSHLRVPNLELIQF